MNTIIGSHVATGARNGWGKVVPYIRGVTTFLLDCVFEVDPQGVVKYYPEAHVVFRPLDVYCWPIGSSHCELDIMPGWNELKLEDMEAQAELWWPQLRDATIAEQDRLEAAFGIRPRVDAIKVTNEVGGTDVDDIKKLIEYERHLAPRAKADGWKLALCNCAGNSPHFEQWVDLFAPFIQWLWTEEAGQHYYQRHVYFDLRPYDENWDRLFREVAYLRGQGETGPVVCSELGYATWPGTSTFMTNIEAWDAEAQAYQEIGHADPFTFGYDWNRGQADISPAADELSRYLSSVPFIRWEPTWPGGTPVEPPPDTKHKAIVLKLGQEHDRGAWRQWGDYAFEKKRTTTASADDTVTVLKGGNKDSYAEIVDPDLASQQETISMLESEGLGWMALGAGNPLEGLQLGAPFRKDFVITSPFNSPRSYGLHEGVDYAMVNQPQDSNEPVLCLYNGTVIRVEHNPQSGYYNYVVVSHLHGDYEFYTWYCHLDDFQVTVGQVVSQGQPIGEVGATGNATGEHLHLNLQVQPGDGLSGYVVPDVVDPAPYVAMDPVSPPPVGKVYDLAKYIKPAVLSNTWEVQHSGGGTETFGVQDKGSGVLWLVKNKNLEEFYIDDEYVWRGLDTSPGPAPDYAERPGADRYYRQFELGNDWARWSRRFMRVGDTYQGPGHYVQFGYKDTCESSDANSGYAVNIITLVDHHESWSGPTGLTCHDVIELSNGTESWFFSAEESMVGWSSPWGSSGIIERHIRTLNPETGCYT